MDQALTQVEQFMNELQHQKRTLDQVMMFQGDQAKVNQQVSQRIKLLEAQQKKNTETLRRILDLLEERTEVG